MKRIPYEAFLKLETGTHSARINQLLVTPDGKTLITSGGDKTIRVWDVETKKQTGMLLGQIGAGSDGKIQAISISPEGRYVAALVWTNPAGTHGDHERETDVRVYERSTGNLQAGFRYPGTLQDLDFSPGGKYLAMVGNPKDTIRRGHVMVYESKKILGGFGKMPPPLASDVLYDNNTLIPSHVRFIPEHRRQDGGYRIVTATWMHNKGQDPEYTGRLLWYSHSASKGLKKLIDLETQERLAPDSLTVSRHLAVITASPLTKDINKKFYCYNHKGKLLKEVASESLPAKPAFSADENQLIVGQRGDSALVQVKVFNTSFGKFDLKSTYYGHDSEVIAVAFLPDGTAVSAGGDENSICFWNTTHMEGEPIAEINGVGRLVHAIGLNAAEQIGIGNHDDLRHEDGSIVLQRIFDLHSMTLKPVSPQDASTFRRAQTKFGKQSLKWMEKYGYTNLYLLPDQIPFTGVPPVGWYSPSTFGFTETGTVITGASDGKIRVAPRNADGNYEPPSRLLVGHAAKVLDHSAFGRWLVTSGADQVIRLWYLKDVEENVMTDLEPALNLFVGSDDEWVIWSKSGYYNASQRGDRRFGYHINRGSSKEAVYFPSDRFIKAFFRPDIIQAVVETGSEKRALDKLKGQGMSIEPVDIFKNLPPIVELTRTIVPEDKKKVTFNFTVEALNPEQPITRAWIVQNEVFAGLADQQGKTYVASLPLTPGRNRFKILAETKQTKSMPVILTLMGPEAKPGRPLLDATGASRGGKEPAVRNAIPERQDLGILYLLAVGVSEFSDTKSGIKLLEYSDDDAQSVFNAFGKADLSVIPDTKGRSESIRTKLKNKAFESVEAVILTNEFAKKASILKEVDRLCTEIIKRAETKKPKRDVLLVFLSGHGIRLVDEKTKDLYFWNYDAVLNDLEKTGLSFMELGRKITNIPADVILATDACHSAMAGTDAVRGLDANELAKLIYAINERGMYILNAARSEELSWEHGKISHGVFTRSLLDALEKDAEPDLSMMGLMNSVQRNVRKYVGDSQTPVFRMYGDLLPLTIFSK